MYKLRFIDFYKAFDRVSHEYYYLLVRNLTINSTYCGIVNQFKLFSSCDTDGWSLMMIVLSKQCS